MKTRSPKSLTVYVFNVGQGDHLLIEFPNGEYGIIDFFHNSEPPIGLYRPPALSVLEEVMVRRRSKPIRIRFAHITHPDLDHTKGVVEFLGWVIENKVKLHEFWLFAGLDFKEVVAQYKQALASVSKPSAGTMSRARQLDYRLAKMHELIQKLRCKQKAVVGVGQIAKIKNTGVVAVAPLPKHIKDLNAKVLKDLFKQILEDKATKSSHNNLMSSVLLIKHGNHRLLFGGDTGHNVWRDCLEYYRETGQAEPHGECNGTFIKVSHHGSKHSSSLNLWRELLCNHSRLAISAGRTLKPNHPDSQTLRHIIRAGKRFGPAPEVVSTNMCSECLGSPKTVVNWFTPRDDAAEEVKIVNNRMRAKGVPKTPPPEFAGYIYKFGDGPTDPVEVTKAFTKSNLTLSPCLFRPKPKERFPRCVDK